MKIEGTKWNFGSKLHTTMVRGDRKLSGNDYVFGRISGIADVIFGGKKISTWYSVEHTGARYFTVYSGPLRYWLFKRKVEKNYPGLCEFDVILKRPEEK